MLLLSMTFHQIEFGSDEFHQECELRHQVLRVPIGLDLYAEDLSQERSQIHFGLFDGGAIVACAIAVALSETGIKIRQMAVSQKHQGQGHGRRLILSIEDYFRRKGRNYFTMHARLTAVAFYEKLGYVRTGLEFAEVGLPHIKIEKTF